MIGRTVLLLVAALASVHAHSYHLGSCPNVDPMTGFEMSKFLGKWYVIQKTSTASSCLVNKYARSNETDQYVIEQLSEHFLLGLGNVNHEYRYEGVISIPDDSQPARMQVRFPLNIIGSASYIVFMTDYENYAGVFSCQKLAFAHRQSATILSRKPTLDKIYVDKVRTRLSTFGIDPYDLSIIKQTDCSAPNDDTLNINIDPTTFTAGSVAGVVRTAGDKIGDGIEVVADHATNLYHRFGGGSDNNQGSTRRRDREELSNPTNDAEWLP